MSRESGGPSAEAGNPAGEGDGAGRDHHPEYPVDPAPALELGDVIKHDGRYRRVVAIYDDVFPPEMLLQ